MSDFVAKSPLPRLTDAEIDEYEAGVKVLMDLGVCSEDPDFVSMQKLVAELRDRRASERKVDWIRVREIRNAWEDRILSVDSEGAPLPLSLADQHIRDLFRAIDSLSRIRKVRV